MLNIKKLEMPSGRLLIVLMMLCSILQSIVMIKAGCVCNERGVDRCKECQENRIIRPKPKSYGAPIGLPPIGDKCWCSSLRVEPAALPKTCEKHNTPNCGCNLTRSFNKFENALYKGPSAYDIPAYNNPPPNYYAAPAPPPVYDSPPADPVSISLAAQAGKTIGVPESKLAFGFIQKPIDGLPKVQFSDVPEENLFKLKNEVITLKKVPYPVKGLEEEPNVEEYEDEEDGGLNDNADLKLTYKQLGYKTEQFVNPKFRQIVPSYGYASNPTYVGPVYAKTRVDCGIRPGRIVPGGNPNCY